MKSDYKEKLNMAVQKKKKDISTSFSAMAVNNILAILEQTPDCLISISNHFDDKTWLEPIVQDKRSFQEILLHFLNIEGLNYLTLYPAFLLNKPEVYPIHAERGLGILGLFTDFQLKELLTAFCLERKKTMSFLKSLKESDWSKQMIKEGKAREETIYLRARALAIHDFTHLQILKLQTNDSIPIESL